MGYKASGVVEVQQNWLLELFYLSHHISVAELGAFCDRQQPCARYMPVTEHIEPMLCADTHEKNTGLLPT
jgi:hypothetical protein